MVSWLASVSGGASVLLLARWLLRVGRPADDWRRVRSLLDAVTSRWDEARAAARRYYGPVTEEMRDAWSRLRSRYRTGGYGIEGT